MEPAFVVRGVLVAELVIHGLHGCHRFSFLLGRIWNLCNPCNPWIICRSRRAAR
jgi:hypothetical protein